MSVWWMWRLLWLFLGLLLGVIALLPESASALSGILVLVFFLAMFTLLGRWAFLAFSEKLKGALEKSASEDVTLASQELLPGMSLKVEASKAEANPPPASESKKELSRFQLAGFRFRTLLKFEEEKPEPRKEALVWDSAFFVAGAVACAALLAK